MDQIQQAIVQDHINDLLRDGDGFRAERRIHGTDRSLDADLEHGRGSSGAAAARRTARVRLGHWLIGVGTAVAGRNGNSNGATGRAA